MKKLIAAFCMIVFVNLTVSGYDLSDFPEMFQDSSGNFIAPIICPEKPVVIHVYDDSGSERREFPENDPTEELRIAGIFSKYNNGKNLTCIPETHVTLRNDVVVYGMCGNSIVKNYVYQNSSCINSIYERTPVEEEWWKMAEEKMKLQEDILIEQPQYIGEIHYRDREGGKILVISGAAENEFNHTIFDIIEDMPEMSGNMCKVQYYNGEVYQYCYTMPEPGIPNRTCTENDTSTSIYGQVFARGFTETHRWWSGDHGVIHPWKELPILDTGIRYIRESFCEDEYFYQAYFECPPGFTADIGYCALMPDASDFNKHFKLCYGYEDGCWELPKVNDMWYDDACADDEFLYITFFYKQRYMILKIDRKNMVVVDVINKYPYYGKLACDGKNLWTMLRLYHKNYIVKLDENYYPIEATMDTYSETGSTWSWDNGLILINKNPYNVDKKDEISSFSINSTEEFNDIRLKSIYSEAIASSEDYIFLGRIHTRTILIFSKSSGEVIDAIIVSRNHSNYMVGMAYADNTLYAVDDYKRPRLYRFSIPDKIVMKCEDSEGDDPLTPGYVVTNYGTFHDECISPRHLFEPRCGKYDETTVPDYHAYECDCRDGRCIVSDPDSFNISTSKEVSWARGSIGVYISDIENMTEDVPLIAEDKLRKAVNDAIAKYSDNPLWQKLNYIEEEAKVDEEDEEEEDDWDGTGVPEFVPKSTPRFYNASRAEKQSATPTPSVSPEDNESPIPELIRILIIAVIIIAALIGFVIVILKLLKLMVE